MRGKFFLFLFIVGYGICRGNDIDSLLTSGELQWLQRHQHHISFAPNPSWPPADFMENDVHRGIVADYIAIFEQRLGVSFFKTSFANWSRLMAGLSDGEVDFVGAIQRTSERDDFLLFSDPYLTVPIVILIKNDYPTVLSSQHINHMKLAGVEDYAYLSHIRSNYPEARVSLYEDDLNALLQTSLGNTDGTIIDLMTASYLVEKYGISNLALGTELDYSWNICFASRKDMPQLASILNKLLKSIDQKQKDDIYKKWVNLSAIRTDSFVERNFTRLVILVIVVASVFMGVVIYNILLKKQVKYKTRALENEITKRKFAYERLKQSEETYKFLFYGGALPKWIYDMETLEIVDVNQAAIDHYGYSREEFLSMTLKDIRPSEDIPKLLDKNRPKITKEATTYAGIWRHKKKSGEIMYVEVFTSAVGHLFGDKTCKMVVCHDITERRRYIETIEHQNNRLRDIAWIQSHLVRAPLVRMMSLIDMAKNPKDMKMDLSELLNHILRSAHELDAIIRDIVKKTDEINTRS